MRISIRFLLLLPIVLTHLAVFGQRPILRKDLQFHSEFEKNAFQVNLSGPEKIDPEAVLRLLIAASPENGEAELNKAQKFLDGLFLELESTKIRDVSLKKASKIIFEKVHKHLDKYESNVPFHEIYQKGAYNCVTASALYAFVLEHFGIEYELREYPLHVNLAIDPKGDNILVEATDPQAGLVAVDKAAVVRELRKQKLISSAEMEEKRPEQVYDTYFEQERKTIDFLQLAAIHYSNMAVLALEMEDYPRALALVNKSIFLADNKLKQASRMWILAVLSDKIDFENPNLPEKLDPVMELLYYEKTRTLSERGLKPIIYKIAENNLLNSSDTARYAPFHRYFIEKLQADSMLLAHEQYCYHYMLAKKAYLKKDLENEVEHLALALQFKPGDGELIRLIEESACSTIYDVIMTDSFADYVAGLLKRFPFLVGNKCIKITNVLRIVSDAELFFEKDKEEDGMAALAKASPDFPMLRTENKANFDQMIGILYGQIFRHFIRQSDYKSAGDWLKKGMELSPNNQLLLRDQDMLDQHLHIYGEDKPVPKKQKG